MWFIKKKKIGIIGYGNMGSAIAERLKIRFPVYVFDKDAAKTANLTGVNVCQGPKELVEIVETVILAIKPQDFEALLKELAGSVQDKLVISIAAGIPTQYIEKILGAVRVIRVMPNLPARIGRGMSCLCKGKFASEGDLRFACAIFNRLGKTLVIKEEMMDAATAVAGSGPAFYCEFLSSQPDGDHERLSREFIGISIAAAQNDWFCPEDAKRVVETMVAGTDALLHEMNLSPSELEKQVASKGGTTEAGLEAFRRTGSLEEAYKAAKQKSQELSKKE